MNSPKYQFRGKRTDTGEWTYGSLIELEDGQCIICVKASTNTLQSYTVIPETVGIYSGFLDFNGCKIFQGDSIARISRQNEKSELERIFIYEVLYKHGGINIITKNDYTIRRDGFPLKDEFWFICDMKRDYPDIDMYLEVIGNIHDDPDLRITP